MITLCCLGYKGLRSLRLLDKKYLTLLHTIYIGTDNNVQNDYSKELKTFCQDNDLSFNITNRASNIDSRFIITIGWRWLIEQIPGKTEALIVFHDSILPKYRGFNPLVSYLINGEKEIGVTALKAVKEFDAGPIIEQKIIKIKYPIKIAEAIDLLSEEYGSLLNAVLNKIAKGELKGVEQNQADATYSLWRDEEDYNINWNRSASEIKRFIDAVGYPYNGASTFLNGKKIIIRDSEIQPDVVIENRCPGKVLFKEGSSLVIVCGEGLLKVKEFYSESGELIHFKKFRLRFESR